MYFQLALAILMASAVVCYDEKFDKIDPDKVIADDALFMSYVNCFLDKGPCTAEFSTEFKELLPQVIADGCAQCTPKQKNSFKKIIIEIFDNKKDLIPEFQAKFDPNNEHAQNILTLIGRN